MYSFWELYSVSDLMKQIFAAFYCVKMWQCMSGLMNKFHYFVLCYTTVVLLLKDFLT